ncbi:MAG: OmpA family protein [Endomicrobiales bacterium]|nr:OmpA family protein [Endomicrobiales bacterium]
MAKPDFESLHKSKQDDDEQSWLLTYSDMMTLLMCFFVILLSMSTLNMAKVELMTQHFARKDKMTLKQLEEKIQEFIEVEKIRDEVNVKLTKKGVEVSFKDKLLFNIGKADLKPAAKPVLSKISGLLGMGDIARRKISVEGHTDSLPIKSEIFPSNWELSSARAANVVKFLIAHDLDSRRFESIGYADTKPVIPESNGNRGLSENRRVIVVISPESFMEDIIRKQLTIDEYKREKLRQQQQQM